MKLRMRQGGFSLLEVLIATIIIGIGLIGVAALQVTSSKFSESAYQQSQAAMLSRELVERARLNMGEAREGNYSFSSLPKLKQNCAGAEMTCSPANMRDHDLRVWASRVSSILPGASAAVASTTPASDLDPVDITITLAWDNSRGQLTAKDTNATCSLDNKPVCAQFTYTLMGLELTSSL